MAKSNEQVEQWIEEHATLTLDRLSSDDADWWMDLAAHRTLLFFRLGEDAIRSRRKKLKLPLPEHEKEVMGLLLELRLKIQMVHDRIDDLPAVPLFDYGGSGFYESSAFALARMLYTQEGGRA